MIMHVLEYKKHSSAQ